MTAKNCTLTQNELKTVLRYDSVTGVFAWIVPLGRASVGTVAGCVAKNSGKSYLVIQYKNRQYFSHRLAWLYVHGEFPSGQIDHIDGNGLNNKIDNLRDVTNQENGMNRRISSNNTSGCIGVFFDKKNGKWKIQINANGKQIHLGYHEDFFDAVCARKSAENRYGYHENHGEARPL